MFVSPYLSSANSQTPKEYTNRARDEIAKKLNLSPATNSTTKLRHGPSPLQRIASVASDLSLTKTSSNDSLDTIQESPTANPEPTKKVKNIFGSLGKLRRRTSSSSMNAPSQESILRHEKGVHDIDPDDVEMTDEDSVSIAPSAMSSAASISQLQPLHPVPSIGSVSTAASNLTANTTQTKATVTDSLFSTQSSLGTTFTNLSNYPIPAPASYHEVGGSKVSPTLLTLQEALPKRFDDMYAPELLADPNLLIDGRPMFTKRALLDWELNDIRSLLIIEKLLPEWNEQLPVIYSPQGFKFEYFPLDADDQYIVKTLVESDIYKEANLDMAFRIQTAKYTLHAARSRHAQILKGCGLPLIYNNILSKPEWRNVIENFLLNLAVEAQCRADFKKACSELKRAKKQGALASGALSPAPTPAPKLNTKGSLLRKAILNDVSQSTSPITPSHTKLTKEEKAQLWMDVQSKVYKRIGLDWTPDSITH